ncbi:vascular endothelial growth factor receptor 2-like [Acanthaster planci]|uniref:receptor protein-tyrosine kinase n=1 Tax=Acanthaster planci TaxID=133434 RepID=A0A8B7ZU70_ACAPL|nr:vascular endothelial growth factor receptor 2-like [Acanthaster planci]
MQSKQDRMDWILRQGGAPSSSTGPAYDHTLEASSGRYTYYRASRRSAGSNALFISPAIVPSKQTFNFPWCFSFWYNMYGSNMGTMNVSRVSIGKMVTDGDVLFSRGCEQTNRTTWLNAEICITNLSSSFFIAFEAIRGSGYLSDMAIDDVESRVHWTSITLNDWSGNYPSFGDIVYAFAGEQRRFTCSVPDVSTPISLSWELGGREVSPDSSDNSTDSNGFITSTSTITLAITGKNHGELLQCLASVAGGHPVVNILVILDVKLQPTATDMLLYVASPTGSPVAPSTDDGTPRSIKCEVLDTRPAVTIQWFLNGELKRTTNPPTGGDDVLVSTVDTWLFTPSRANHGHEVKCVANNSESEEPFPSKVLTLLVNSPPDIPTIIGSLKMMANETNTLECLGYMGYPDDWILVWSIGQALVPSTTTSEALGQWFTFKSRIIFKPQKEDSGEKITCLARRRSWTRPLTQRIFGPIDVQYPPEFSGVNISQQGPISEGDDVILYCNADANPKPSNFITWEKVGSPDPLPSVYSDGTSTLTLFSISREQAGRYRCRGDNGVPPIAVSRLMDVILRLKPLPPVDVTIQKRRRTKESLTIAWTTGSDGGEEQWFYVNYRELESTPVFDPATRSIRLRGVSEYTLVGLHPDTAYEVEVFAENAHGASSAVTAVGTTDLEFDLPNWSLLTAVGTLAILLVLSVTGNLVFCQKRSIKTPRKENRKWVTKRETESGVLNRIKETGENYENVGIVMQTIHAENPGPVESTYADIPDCRAAFSRDQLTFLRELSRGAFFKLLLAKANGIERQGVVNPVAVKTVKDDTSRRDKDNLMQELNAKKSLNFHDNVVKLLGYCIEKDPVYIIMEYMANGTLKELLTDNWSQLDQVYDNLRGAANTSLTPRTLLRMAKGVADGMAFLASHTCLHKDLAARNVFLGEGMVCKLSNFGFANDVATVRKNQRQNQGLVPLRWMALESVLYDVYTTESDVWSFGVLLWEIVTLGAQPYPAMSAKKVARKVKSGYRMPRPGHCHLQLYQLMLDCWAKNPSARPNFSTVSGKLGGLQEKAYQYISLEAYQRHLYKAQVAGCSDCEKIY